MTQNKILFLICAACFLWYFILSIKKRPASLLFLAGRSMAGLSFIYCFNLFCAARDIVTGIGINPLSGIVCMLLGIPGALLMYAVKLCSLL